MTETALLVVNTRFVGQQAKNGAAVEMSTEPQKAVVGLLRVKYAPSGVDVEQLAGDDLQVYKRGLRWQRLRGIQHLLDGHRVQKCYRTRIKPSVEIWRSNETQKAFYAGLMVCGSVWSCPVCAAKITERRKNDIEQAPRINDFAKVMVTYTIQHNASDRLGSLFADLCAGLRDMKQMHAYRDLREKYKLIGEIIGAEVTVSNVNGWHPHKHALLFSELSQIDAEQLRDELSSLFVLAMAKRGRYVHEQIGVNVQSENVISSYVAKMGEGEKKTNWSLAHEIAKSPVKTGRDENHFHPFELVEMYLTGNIQAGRLFKEYAVTMKGKKQLFYSRGLRARLGLDVDVSDQEIAERIEDHAALLAMLEPEHWAKIIQHEKRGQLLEVAAKGYNALVVYMRAIGCKDFGKGGESIGA